MRSRWLQVRECPPSVTVTTTVRLEVAPLGPIPRSDGSL